MLEFIPLECRGLLRKDREKKHEGITEVVKPFDWSYSTDYKGTLRSPSPSFESTTTPIPLELLKRPDPILFFDEIVLYEDEMADNGITMYSCKIRVMPARLLLLCRFFMRLDNVVLRIRDTRVYVDFGTGEVIREYIAKEEKYEVVRQVRSTAETFHLCTTKFCLPETCIERPRCASAATRSKQHK